MKSIRRSLIFNVLILLVLTLGAVFGIVYSITSQTLEEKKLAARALTRIKSPLTPPECKL